MYTKMNNGEQIKVKEEQRNCFTDNEFDSQQNEQGEETVCIGDDFYDAGDNNHNACNILKKGYHLQDPGERCGEIFVTNNAKKWTFICTFCEKGTTEIDEFIFHIKQVHIHAGIDFDSSSEDENIPEMPTKDNISDEFHSNLETLPYPVKIKQESPVNTLNSNDGSSKKNVQEYLDYNCYLDVKVHTDSDTICYNENDNSANSTRPNDSFWKNTSNEYEAEDDNQNAEGHMKSEPPSSESDSEEETFENSHRNLGVDSYQFNGNETDDEEEAEEIRPDDDYSHLHERKLLAASLIDSTEPSNSWNTEKNHRQRKRKSRSRRAQIRGPAYCGICKRTFQYYSLYRNHMIKHTDETPFKCQNCNKGFKSKQALRYHMSTHQRVKAFKCTICEYSFYQESMFITHLQTHQNDSTFPCMECGKLHRSRSERDIHMRVHTGERPFQCDFCFKRFRLRHHLSNHLKLHRQYNCDFCKRKFSSANALRKPYSCQSCSKSLRDKQLVSEATISSPLKVSRSTVATTSSSSSTSAAINPISCATSTALLTTEAVAAVLSQKPSSLSQIPKPYACKNCHKTYAQLGGLNFHIKTKHQQD